MDPRAYPHGRFHWTVWSALRIDLYCRETWMQVGGVMGVTMCVFSGVGTQLFAHVRHGDAYGLTRSVNFETFSNSMLLLFQIMTSAWKSPFNSRLWLCYYQTFTKISYSSMSDSQNSICAKLHLHGNRRYDSKFWHLPASDVKLTNLCNAGDNWRRIMNDCKNQAPFCTVHPGLGVPSDCGFTIGATVYFIIYLLFAAYLIVSLFMSSVAQYVSYNLLVNGAAALSLSDLHHFRVRWSCERNRSLTVASKYLSWAVLVDDSRAIAMSHENLNFLSLHKGERVNEYGVFCGQVPIIWHIDWVNTLIYVRKDMSTDPEAHDYDMQICIHRPNDKNAIVLKGCRTCN